MVTINHRYESGPDDDSMPSRLVSSDRVIIPSASFLAKGQLRRALNLQSPGTNPYDSGVSPFEWDGLGAGG